MNKNNKRKVFGLIIWLGVLVIVVGIVGSGCYQSKYPPVFGGNETQTTNTSGSKINTSGTQIVKSSVSSGDDVLRSARIEYGKLYIDNLYPGVAFEKDIKVYNDNNVEKKYIATVKVPDYVDVGYEKADVNIVNWVIVEPNEFVIPSNGCVTVTVKGYLPEDCVVSDKWQFWIGFKDAITTGMFKTEINIKWYVDMRN